jgi:hypothetical protein
LRISLRDAYVGALLSHELEQDVYWAWEEAFDALLDHGEALQRAAGLSE